MFVALLQCISKLKDPDLLPILLHYLLFYLYFGIFSHIIGIMLHDMDPQLLQTMLERFVCQSPVTLKQLNSTVFQVHPHQDHHTQPRCDWPS